MRRILLVSLIMMAGCSRQQPVFPVKGQVLFEGKPLAGAVVVLHRKNDKGPNLTTVTDDQGRFQVTTHKPGDGAPVGDYGVTVEFRDLVKDGDEESRRGQNLLNPRYSKTETSGFHCEVKPGTNELPAWNLASN